MDQLERRHGFGEGSARCCRGAYCDVGRWIVVKGSARENSKVGYHALRSIKKITHASVDDRHCMDHGRETKQLKEK